MAAFEGYLPDLRDRLKPWIHGAVCDFIMFLVDKEGLDLYGMGFLPSFPTLDRANDDELCRTLTVLQFEFSFSLWPDLKVRIYDYLHCYIGGRVFLDVLEYREHLIRQRV